MSSQFGFVFGAGASSSNNPNPAPSSSAPSSDQAAPSSSFSFGTGSTDQFTFGTASMSVQKHIEEQVKELQDKLKIAQNAIETQRKQIADTDKGRAMAEVRIVELEIELEAEKKKTSEKIGRLEAQLAAKEEDALVLEVARLGDELREKEEQLLYQMEEKWNQFDQIQEASKALDLVKGEWASRVQEIEDERQVAEAALEAHALSIEDINTGVWAMVKELRDEKKLTEILDQKTISLDEEVKESKAAKNMLRFFNIQQKSANSNTKTKLFQKILDLEAENQNMKEELSFLGSWSQSSSFLIGWLRPFILLMLVTLAFAGFWTGLWAAFGWQEQPGAFGYGGPNVDNRFTRLLAFICAVSNDLLPG